MSNEQYKTVIYTDGSCIGNPGVGGWGAVLITGDVIKELSGCEEQTTNNRMEMYACIAALESCGVGDACLVVSDSQYVVNGVIKHSPSWRKRDGVFLNSKRKPIANSDLWILLLAECDKRMVSFQWEAGHAGKGHNQTAHDLAYNEARDLEDKLCPLLK